MLRVPQRFDSDVVGPVRYRELAGDVLLTNDFGEWMFLTPTDFEAFIEGRIATDGNTFAELRRKNFVKSGIETTDAVRKLRRLQSHVGTGPQLHTLVLRGSDPDADDGLVHAMTAETGERCLDTAFMTTSQRIEVRFSGGDLASSWALVQALASYAQDKNDLARKRLTLAWSGALGELSDAQRAWLAEQGFHAIVPVSPAGLADPAMRQGLQALNAALGAPALLQLVIEGPVPDSPEPLAEFMRGTACATVELRPSANRTFLTGEPGGCDPEAWAAFYAAAFDALLAGGLAEHNASLLLAKILTGVCPDEVAFRSPSAEGIGQLAYHWDGKVFTSASGLAVYELGDPMFWIGDVRSTGYHDLMTHPTVRALVMATTLEAQPGWSTSAYKPFAGLSPVDDYTEHGTIHGRTLESSSSVRYTALLDLLFSRLHHSDQGLRDRLFEWAQRAQPLD